MSTALRSIRLTAMHNLPVNQNKRPLRHWHRDKILVRIHRSLAIVGHQAGRCRINGALVSLMHTGAVRCPNELQASVLQRRILQRNPETDRRLGFRVQKRRILMGRHLATDAGIFVNVHTLRHGWPTETQLATNALDVRAERQPPENFVLGVQRMADLVEGMFGRNEQLAVGVQGVLLEEAAHLVAGLDEIVVSVLRPAVTLVGGRGKGVPVGARSVDGQIVTSGQQLGAFVGA